MDDMKVVAASALCLLSLSNYVNVLKRTYTVGERRQRRKRSLWMSSVHRNRTLSSMDNFFNEMSCVESGEFNNFFKMSPTDFEFLLNKLEPMIKKQSGMRIPIPPKIRLAITLRYLTTGDSYRSLHNTFKVSAPAISLIVPEVCSAINHVLRDQIKLPQTPDEWLGVEEKFRKKFPRCVGAIGGKYVVAQSQARSGSEYYNVMGIYRYLLTALVGTDYRFIFADIAEQERDGKIFKNSSLWQVINSHSINLPPDAPLLGRKNKVPYVFLGDETFTLHKNIMNPFPGNHDIGSAERIFNHKLTNTRIIIDNVFGVLTSNFQIFKKPMEIDLKKVPIVTMTCILLHNFLIQSESSREIYTPPGTLDSIVKGQYVKGSWRQNQSNTLAIRSISHVAHQPSNNISQIRSEFAHYFHNLN